MVCLNPRLRRERARKRAALLRATEAALHRIAASVRSGRLKGRKAIGTEAAVEACKSLAGVERAFRNAKGDLRR